MQISTSEKSMEFGKSDFGGVNKPLFYTTMFIERKNLLWRHKKPQEVFAVRF